MKRHEFVRPLELCCMPGCTNRPWGWLFTADVCLPCARAIADRVERHDPDRQEAVRARGRNRGRAGWIYYLRVEGLIKIGFAVHLETRLRSYPPTTVVLGYHPGTWDEEQELHRHFRAFLHSGREWYREAPELLQHIAQLPTHTLPRVTETAWPSKPTGQAVRMRARSRH